MTGNRDSCARFMLGELDLGSDLLVDLGLMVEIITHRRMSLRRGQIRMLTTHLVR